MSKANPLIKASRTLNFAAMGRLVREGFRCDLAFLSDQGSTLCEDDEGHHEILEKASQRRGLKIENENHLLFEVYETLILAGHKPPDGSSRRCVVRIIGGADASRQDRATVLMAKCADHGMLDWRTSQWAIENEKSSDKDASSRAFSAAPLGRPDELFSDAMAEAAEVGNLAMLKILARSLPEDVHARKKMLCSSRLATQKAVIGGHIECLEYLFTLMPEPMWLHAPLKSNNTMPAIAAANSQEGMLRWLVDHGFDINAYCDGTMKNILASTMEARQPGMIPVLLELGADPANIPDGSPSPLQVAVWHNHDSLIEPLIQAGAPIEYSDSTGMTPLLMAGMVGNHVAADRLIKTGADIEARDHQGRTPIFWAAQNDRLETFEVLLAGAARIDVVAHDGSTVGSRAKGRIIPRLAQAEQDGMLARTPKIDTEQAGKPLRM